MSRIKCPCCGALQDFDDSWKEQVRKCSACKQDVRIPAAATQHPVTTSSPRARLAPEPLPAASVRPAPLALSEGLDTSIQKDRDRVKACPVAESLPAEKRPLGSGTGVGSGGAADLTQTDDTSILDRDVAAEVRLVEKKRVKLAMCAK